MLSNTSVSGSESSRIYFAKPLCYTLGNAIHLIFHLQMPRKIEREREKV